MPPLDLSLSGVPSRAGTGAGVAPWAGIPTGAADSPASGHDEAVGLKLPSACRCAICRKYEKYALPPLAGRDRVAETSEAWILTVATLRSASCVLAEHCVFGALRIACAFRQVVTL